VTDWHPQSQFTYLDADRHNLFARATLDLDPSFSLGLQGDISFTVYDSTRFQNNGAIYSFGPFYRWKLSEYLTWQSGGGITGGFFDRGGLNRDGQDPNGFYAYTQLLHKASEYFSHSLNLNRTTQFGLNTNFVEVTSARYNAAWKAFPSVTFNLQVFGEYAEESGRYGFAENAARYGAGVGVSRQLNDHLSVSASYNYVQKDSNLFLQDYYQNRVILELAYRF
jgi:opacity protein-like surface antigen